MACLVLSLILMFSFCGRVHKQDGGAGSKQTEYRGKLQTELVPNDGPFSVPPVKLISPGPNDRARLPARLKKGDLASMAKLKLGTRGDHWVQVMLIEPAKGAAYLYADTDRNGTFEVGERFSFSPVENQPDLDGETLIKLPLLTGLFREYPILVRLYKTGRAPHFTEATGRIPRGSQRGLSYTRGALARGAVDIDGRKIQVQYEFDPTTGTVDPNNGQVGVDTDNDGRINTNPSPPSPESANAESETIVFRVGHHYVSTKTVDATTGQIVMRAHPESDYQLIELVAGNEVPDFSLTDLAGRTRKLSDFRGKYLLVDIWATWCKPCVADVPRLKETYEKYQARGFEILGIDNEVPGRDITTADIAEGLQRAKAFTAEKAISWTQANPESSKLLAEKRFRVTGYPTMVLLDPKGKIVSFGFKTEELREELEKLLPNSASQ